MYQEKSTQSILGYPEDYLSNITWVLYLSFYSFFLLIPKVMILVNPLMKADTIPLDTSSLSLNIQDRTTKQMNPRAMSKAYV